MQYRSACRLVWLRPLTSKTPFFTAHVHGKEVEVTFHAGSHNNHWKKPLGTYGYFQTQKITPREVRRWEDCHINFRHMVRTVLSRNIDFTYWCSRTTYNLSNQLNTPQTKKCIFYILATLILESEFYLPSLNVWRCSSKSLLTQSVFNIILCNNTGISKH